MDMKCIFAEISQVEQICQTIGETKVGELQSCVNTKPLTVFDKISVIFPIDRGIRYMTVPCETSHPATQDRCMLLSKILTERSGIHL